MLLLADKMMLYVSTSHVDAALQLCLKNLAESLEDWSTPGK